MRQKHPEAVAHCYDTILPSGNSFKFVLDNNPPPGWSIFHLNGDSEVSMLLQHYILLFVFIFSVV